MKSYIEKLENAADDLRHAANLAKTGDLNSLIYIFSLGRTGQPVGSKTAHLPSIAAGTANEAGKQIAGLLNRILEKTKIRAVFHGCESVNFVYESEALSRKLGELILSNRRIVWDARSFKGIKEDIKTNAAIQILYAEEALRGMDFVFEAKG